MGRKSPLPAVLYSLSVEGVLARQHPQLLLRLEILQADGTGLLREMRVGLGMVRTHRTL